MGYSEGQLAEMEKIIDAADVDLVVIGTPIDLRRVIDIRKPAVRVRYDLEVLPDSPTPARRAEAGPVAAGQGREVADGTGRRRARRQRPAPPRRRTTRSRRCTAARARRPSASPTSRPTGWEVVVTHGNGPQVGRILLQQEAAREVVHPMPLDVCGAESQGQIGYLLQVTIGDVFFERGMERPVAHGPHAHARPPRRPRVPRTRRSSIGPFYEEDEARTLEAERGYVMKADPHGGWRRVVPSPTPYSIVETPVIRAAGRRRHDRDRGRRREASR